MTNHKVNRFLIVCGGTGINLLGLRRILGLSAELQIDVSRENVIRKRRVYDRNSLYVDLDKVNGTTAIVIENATNAIVINEGEKTQNEEGSEYLHKMIIDPADIHHVKFLMEHYPIANPLEYGLAQSPAVGKYTVMQDLNRLELEQSFSKMLRSEFTVVGPSNPVEVWMISSTAGGTGEGIHRYVGALFANYLKNSHANTSLTLNFIRVGQLTYNSVNHERTSLNSFFGVAADAAFALKAKDDFPHTTTNWFYVDLPDVGTGDRAKHDRAEIVEMACKAIMLDDLQDDLQKLLVNNAGIPMVVVRTGYWGRDFDDNLKYYETLRQLTIKLKDLTEPNYQRKYIDGKLTPQFIGSSLDQWTREVQSPKFVIDKMDKANWEFPRYRLTGFPTQLAVVEDLIPRWIQSMNELLGLDIDDLEVSYQVEEVIQVDDREQRQKVSLAVPSNIEDDEDWFAKIDNIHRTRAWSMNLLGVDFITREINNQGMIAELLTQAKEISGCFHGFNPFTGNDAKARTASRLLGEFLTRLVKINHLLLLERQSAQTLDRELGQPKEVLKNAINEFEIAKNLTGANRTTSVQAAELSDMLDRLARKTWLRLLRDAVRSGDPDRFRDEVIRGATGLTRSGLISVLSLHQTAEIADVQNALSSSMGRMVSSNNDSGIEAPWWKGARPSATMEFQYRILPQLDRDLQASLRSRGEQDTLDYRYVYTGLGVVGLYVLAFHGVSMNREGPDTISAPAFLLSPFVPTVRQALKRWVPNPVPNLPSGQFEIAAAGTMGEPLYKDALVKAGLTKQELDKIGYFYKFFESGTKTKSKPE